MRRLVLALAAVAAAAPRAPADPALVHGAPTLNARALAITDDGATAVSADFAGSIRLWPALDGTREPVVVTANPPVALAIARDGDGLAIVGADAAGGVELIRTSRLGAPSSRAELALDRPAIAIGAVAGGVVVERDDQMLAIFDLRGAPTAVLVPDPGERIASIVFRGDRALALVTAGKHMRGRWIDVAGARWGDRTPALPITRGSALSPDLRHLAGDDRKGLPAIVDLTTGKTTAHPAPPDLGEGETVHALAFTDAHTLALARDSSELGWWNQDGWTTPKDDSLGGPIAAGGGHLVTIGAGIITLATNDDRRFLGYRLVDPEIVRPSGKGLLVSDRHQIVLTDAHLQQTHALKIPMIEDRSEDVIPIDAHHALAFRYDQSASGVYELDLDFGSSVLVGSSDRGGLSYDPGTHLAAWATRSAIEFARVDRKTGALSTPVEFPLARDCCDSAILLDPSRGHGDLAVIVQEEGDGGATITPVREITPGKPIVTGKPRTYASDTNWFASLDQPDVFGYPSTRRKSPDGTLSAELASNRVTLRDATGERWTIAAPGAHDLVWTADGGLIVVGEGLARVDLDSGAYVNRQCGWEFGISDQPATAGDGRMCDAP